MQGWVKDYRVDENHWLHPVQEDRAFTKYEAWKDLIKMVNHEDKKTMQGNDLITVKRGDRLTSIKKLEKRWKWSNTKVKSFLTLLQNDNMIKFESTYGKNTLITIVNYEKWQGNKEDSEEEKEEKNITNTSQEHHESISEAFQKHTNKNDKELKELKEIYIQVFEHWNSKEIIVHRELTQKRKSVINARLEKYTLEEIIKTIDNYSEILKSDLHYYSHKFTLDNFLNPKNFENFTDKNNPFENYRDKFKSSKSSTDNSFDDYLKSLD